MKNFNTNQFLSQKFLLGRTVWKSGSETVKGDLGGTEREAGERGRERRREEIEKSASSVTLSAEQNCIPERERGLPSFPPSL